MFVGAGLVAACGGRGGQPPGVPPLVKRADGKEYHLVVKGAYKAYYDLYGQLQIIEYDENGDGRPDHIAHHDGKKKPHLIEIDEDYDGKIDRWEDYDAEGKLVKVGVSRRGNGPDLWTYFGPSGAPIKKEYDEDGDGKVDRIEWLEAGEVARVELDTDRDGKIDRWQVWRNGKLVSEELDTNGDGRPDKRIDYSVAGAPLRLQPLPR